MNLPLGAIRAIARTELRRCRRALLAVGLIAGLVGASVAGAAATARRTATAHDRLERAVHVEDLRVLVFDRSLTGDVGALPGVRAAWEASLFVGRIEGRGAINYLGMVSGPPRPADLYTPIVVDGRMFDDDAAEAVVLEQAVEPLGIDLGDELVLAMLTPEEVAMFDTGFGDPDGPTVRIRITGVVRTPSDLDGSPLLVSPAFAAAHAELAAATSMFVRLDDDPAARSTFLAGTDELAARADRVPGAEEFPPIEVADPGRSESTVEATARVLVTGLAVFAAVLAAVGLLVVAQVLARHHAGGAGDQRVEAALGLTAGERALARVLPATLAAAVAAAVTFAGTLVAGVLEPFGSMRQVEPFPGFSPNVAIAAAAAVVSATFVLALAAITAWRAGIDAAWTRPLPARAVGTARAVAGRPAVVAGVGFALSGARGRAAPMRSSLLGAAAGIAGLVAALTFASSLHRLADEPLRYGWSGDFTVVDVTEPIVRDLLDDPRLESVTFVESSAVEIDGVAAQGYSFRDLRGSNMWTIVDGRAPSANDEVVIGSGVADRIDRDVGDVVTATAADGTSVELRIVGRGIGPNLNGEDLGDAVLLTPGRLASVERTQSFDEAIASTVPGVDPAAVSAELAARYEVIPRDMPVEVQNLANLGRLPETLGGFLAGVAVLALAHALVVTTTRRSSDIAVLRSVGLTGREAAATIAVMAVTVTAAGLVLGVPLGFGLGRLLWWAVADSVGVATDASYPLLGTLVAVPALLAIAIAVSWWPGRRAAKLQPVQVLRAE